AAIRPTNAAARAEPSARAVRFYVASGLLDHPEGTGTAATYSYRHLLQLLFVKIRQREGQTLEKIKLEIKDLLGDSLERRVASSLSPSLFGDADVANSQDPHDTPDSDAVWHRIAVANGIELHVRDDSPAADREVSLAIREAVRAALNYGLQGSGGRVQE
ncbi:MAG TPA: MerR family transcriptional regulator, partial [Gemmatimonadaceae bacterium]